MHRAQRRQLNVSHHDRLNTFRSLNTSWQYDTTTDNERLPPPSIGIVHIGPAPHASLYVQSGRRNILRLWSLGALSDVEIDLLILF